MMSDQAWLGAMKKYDGSVEHKDILKGGAYELVSALKEQIKDNPTRFFCVFQRVPDDVDHTYLIAFLNGFAESDGSEKYFFNVINRFGHQEDRNLKRPIAWAVEKYAKAKVSIPDEVLNLLYHWVYGLYS